MLKSLFPTIDWDHVTCVGFDMDGTLYDEFEFIKQVYEPISRVIAKKINKPFETVYVELMWKWLEKGSSYNKIFEEYLVPYVVGERERLEVINNCLDIFRNFSPCIMLSERVRILLDYFSLNYELFLVTDGRFMLQQAKFRSLGLARWFKEENVLFTGIYGKEFEKPSILIPTKIEVLQHIERSQSVVFFGDREQDYMFAKSLNYQYVQTYCLREEKEWYEKEKSLRGNGDSLRI